METEWEAFIHWYIDEVFGTWEVRKQLKYKERMRLRDKIHHIIYHWTEEKHPQKINLVWKLWKENSALRRQVQ